MNGVIEGIFCPGIILPIRPDTVEDGGVADVEDEEGEGPNQGNDDPNCPCSINSDQGEEKRRKG